MSTSLGLWTELGLQAVGVQVAAGSSFSVGDVVPTGRALSEPEEGSE